MRWPSRPDVRLVRGAAIGLVLALVLPVVVNDTVFADWAVTKLERLLKPVLGFFGVPIPVWYPLDSAGEPQWDAPISPSEDSLPVDPQADAAGASLLLGLQFVDLVEVHLHLGDGARGHGLQAGVVAAVGIAL